MRPTRCAGRREVCYEKPVQTIVFVSACALAGALLPYPSEARGRTTPHHGVTQVLADMRELFAASGDVRPVLMLSASAGVIMLTAETYWQLSFQQLAGVGSEWMLGPVNCVGMVAAFGISGAWPTFAVLALLLELVAFRGKDGKHTRRK